jgi:hypothetical protein
MVASISARGRAKAALTYCDHLRRDDYYTRGGEPPDRWAGEAAERGGNTEIKRLAQAVARPRVLLT